MTSIDEFEILHENKYYKYYVNGEWRAPKENRYIPIKNPLNEEIIGHISACNTDEIDEIVQFSNNNKGCWADTPLEERATILNAAATLMDEWAEELGDILVREIGKPVNSARGEIKRTAKIFRATAEAKEVFTGETKKGDIFMKKYRDKISLTFRVPLGVILCIGPFNYPFNLTGSKIAPALMAGNAVVMKPPTEGAITALHFGVILEKAGVPPGVFNIATGRGSEIGDYLVSHPKIDMVSFTGSSKTGQHIAEIVGMKPLLLELGGKDAAIVLDDADIEKTADSIISGAFKYNGQRCTAVKRVLVMPQIADKLIVVITERAKHLSIGDPAENKNIGPLIDAKQCDYVQGLIDDALEKGAELKCGN